MWITWRASLLQLPGWGSPPRPSHSTAWTPEGTHNTTAPFAVVEAILDRQAYLAARASSLVSSQVVHRWPLEPSQHLGTPLKTAPGIFRLYHPTLSCHLSIFHFFFFNLHGTCGFPDSCSFRCFERKVCLSSGGSFSLTAPQPPSISSWPSFPGGRILASLLLGRKALTQPFENSQNHMVFEDCIQFYAGCLATWLALNPLISSWGLSLISLGWKECISFCQKSPSFPYKVAIGIK